jgi:rare lipoprotein A
MRLFDENARRFASAALALGLAAALSGCGAFGGGHDAVLSDALPPPTTGPAADYPVVIGDPYRIDGVAYTPSDALNYDEVGYAMLDGNGGDKVTAAHHTLPVPSYIEVTSLTSGRTILVRVERRGPMSDNSLVALSPGAAAQLGVSDKGPVRVRRVNPPEPERAALRLGGRAANRLETPETLLSVLRRKLPGEGSATLAVATPATAPPRAVTQVSPTALAGARPVTAPATPAVAPELPPLAPLAVASTPKTAAPQPPALAPARRPTPQVAAAAAPAPTARATPQPAPKPAAKPPVVAANGKFVVQAGAFSSAASAKKVANAIGGSVTQAGSLFRVRTGPFASRGQAEASLAKVKAAGYSEARIFTNG